MANLDEDTKLSSSSDDEEEEPRGSNNQGINLTGFLFGNIDRDGHLEENFLDEIVCYKESNVYINWSDLRVLKHREG